MVAIRKGIEPEPSRRDERFGEHRRPSRFEPSVETDSTDRFAVPRGVDTLIPTVAPTTAQEPRPRSKQPASPAVGRAAFQTRPAELRAATDRVLDELARIAFADIGDVFDERGAVIPFADLPPGVRSALAEYRVRRSRNGTYVVSVRLHSKLAALTALGRHLGAFGRHSDRATLGR